MFRNALRQDVQDQQTGAASGTASGAASEEATRRKRGTMLNFDLDDIAYYLKWEMPVPFTYSNYYSMWIFFYIKSNKSYTGKKHNT